MAEANVNTDALTKLAAKMRGLTGKELPRIDRSGLRAVGAVVKTALLDATPIAATDPTLGSTALPKGALKEAVRTRVLPARGDRGAASDTDFGKSNYVANFVDGGTSHSAATGFVRAVQDGIAEQAEQAYVTAAEAEVERIMNDGQ